MSQHNDVARELDLVQGLIAHARAHAERGNSQAVAEAARDAWRRLTGLLGELPDRSDFDA